MIPHEVSLAWGLALAVKPHLDAVERNDIFVTIGAGETFAAITHLLRVAAVKRIPVGPDVVQQCTSWLHAYVGHTDERYLRHLIENYLIPYSLHVLARLPVNRRPTTPGNGQVVALAAQQHRTGSAPEAPFSITAGIG
jgi:hypothetical protein